MVDDFSHQIVKELDFTRDARNADRMIEELPECTGHPVPEDLLGILLTAGPGHGIY